jgi:hypothetical protein
MNTASPVASNVVRLLARVFTFQPVRVLCKPSEDMLGSASFHCVWFDDVPEVWIDRSLSTAERARLRRLETPHARRNAANLPAVANDWRPSRKEA